MNKVRHICVFALLLVAAGTARAQQWYGNVDGAGGFGWMKSLRARIPTLSTGWEKEMWALDTRAPNSSGAPS